MENKINRLFYAQKRDFGSQFRFFVEIPNSVQLLFLLEAVDGVLKT